MIQFKRKYLELTVREQKLIFKIISASELVEIFDRWERDFKISLRQLQNNDSLPIQIIGEIAKELHKQYAGDEELTLDELNSLSPAEIGFMFGAISNVENKNQVDPKVVLR